MKKPLIYLLIAISLVFQCKKDSPYPWSAERMASVRGYENWYIGTFRCGIFVPPAYDAGKKYPLVIYLHGHTDTISWNLGWYNDPVLTNDPCIVLTPKCPKEEIYGWGDSYDPRISPMMAKTYEMVDLVKEAFNIDNERFYIHGTSMGGYGTYGALQKNPDLFAAAYVECGRPNIAIVPLVASIPLWIFHGSVDIVVPVQPTRDFYKAVVDYGGSQIRYTEYKGVGHNTWDYTKFETTLASWLLAQRKGSVHNPPEGIKNFKAEVSENNVVLLTWNLPPMYGSVMDNRVWYCKIFRNGNVISEVYNNKANYSDTLLNHPSDNEYRISAVNYYFRESALSESLLITAR